MQIHFCFIVIVQNLFFVNEIMGKYCRDPKCVLFGFFIRQTLNESVNPCDNFYEFACGNAKQSVINLAQTQLNSRLLRVITEKEPKVDRYPLIKFIKNAYRRCVQGSGRKMKNQIGDITKTIGKWPIYCCSDKMKLNKLWMRLVRFDVGPIFSIHSSLNELQIDVSPYFREHAVYYLSGADTIDESMEEDYYEVMLEIANLLGGKWPAVELRHAFAFGVKISKALVNTLPLYNIMEYHALNDEVFHNIPMKEILLEVTGCCKGNQRNTKVIIRNFMFFQTLDIIIGITDEIVVGNFLKWMIIKIFAYDFGDKQIIETLRKLETKRVQQYRCEKRILNYFQYPIFWLYLQKFNTSSYEEYYESFLEIQKTVIDNLRALHDLDETTKLNAIDKIKDIRGHIGYPDYITNITYLIETYKLLKISKRYTIGESLLKYRLDMYKYRRHKFGRQPDKNGSDWFVSNINYFNAFYATALNTINIYQPTLDTSVYACKRLKYILYGGIGGTLGHEIIHAIDSNGRFYNKEGIRQNWWTRQGQKWFHNRAKCFIDQYDKYFWPPADRYVKGKFTLAENIADHSLKFVYQTYQNVIGKETEPEADLEMLDDFTHNQIFWLVNAQFFCGDDTTRHLMKRPFGPHAPGRFRVNGVMENSEEFAKDFNCPLGSPMNPKKKCSIY